MADEMDGKAVEDVMRLLDAFGASETSRMKIEVSDELETGSVRRQYHHGRCDIGSPWARGECFDGLEPEEGTGEPK